MSISSEITRISGNVADALEAIADKGVTVPSDANSDDLADLISQISGGGVIITETTDSHGGTIVEITAEDVIRLQSKTATPSETQQTISPDTAQGYTALSQVVVGAISSAYVGSGITRRNSSSLSANGATVTVPAGYYEEAATKSVSSGSATAPGTISGTGASISTGTNTLTLSKTVSVTPQVSAGYVSSGTAANSSVSLTASVTTQAAQTIYPSTSDQTISASRYLTGTQTIKGVAIANLTAGNIKNGVTITVGDSADADRITSVTGTYTGGGGSGIGTLLATSTIGTVSTTSTQSANLNKDISVSGINGYDLLIVEASVDSVTNGRHCATISTIFLTASTTIGTKNGGTVASNKMNIRVSSNGTYTSVQSTTAYGIYANSISISNGNATIPMYRRYNSNSTTTINGSYTARVYGVKLYDLIGG